MNLREASLLALSLVLPAVASAQATDFGEISLVDTGSVDDLINLEECEADQELTLSWSLVGTPSSGQTVTITTDTVSGCTSTTPMATLYDGVAPSTPRTDTVKVRTDLHADECTEQEDHDRFLCFTLDGGTLTEAVVVPVVLTFDTLVPGDPTVSAVAGDETLRVSWAFSGDPDSDVDGYRVAWQVAGQTSASAVERSATLSSSTETYSLGGLTNDTEYEVWVETRDDFGNWSAGSASVLGTPRASDDFWEHYRVSGGAQAGCAQGGSNISLFGLLLILPALGLLLRRRVLGGWLLGLGAAALFLLPAAASAEPWVDEDRAWNLQLEIGPYLPEVDDETSGSTPYADIFGTKKELLGRFRLERAIWQGIGQIDIGLGAGFGQAVGKGLYPDGTTSSDTTVFNWVPLDLTLTYRFDYAALEWDIPLVPYARAGLVWDLWWILDGSGGVATDAAGERAQGGRWGFEYEMGLQLLLDGLDPRLAADFQRSSGVDNSYLFFGYRRMQIDGFGSEGFDLSDTTWSAGLVIEF